MQREIKLCHLKFILSWMRVRGTLPPDVVLAIKIGKALEQYRAAGSKQERRAAVRSLVKRVKPEEIRPAMLRLRTCIENAQAVDVAHKDHTGKRKSFKGPQYYAVVPGAPKWRLAARPDEVQSESGLLRVIDEKTTGRMSQRLRHIFFFFGLVVYLSEAEKIEAAYGTAMEAWKKACDAERKRCNHRNRSHQGKKNKGRTVQFERPFYPARPVKAKVPDIELMPLLTGTVKNEAGEDVAAPQPASFFFSPFRAGADIDRALEAIAMIEEAFAKKEFPARTNPTCKFCPYRIGCPGFAEYERTHQPTSDLVQITANNSSKEASAVDLATSASTPVDGCTAYEFAH
ncbi:MAG TPA: PD-(D/E)XK nuclease family protein [Planktothrix sp.]